ARPEVRVIQHVGDKSVRRRVFRISGDELFQVFVLEEVEDGGTVADDFEIGVVHGQLAEAEDAATMVDIRSRAIGRFQRGGAPARFEFLDDLPVFDGYADYAPQHVRRRRQRTRREDDIVALDAHSALGLLVDQFGQVFTEKVK